MAPRYQSNIYDDPNQEEQDPSSNFGISDLSNALDVGPSAPASPYPGMIIEPGRTPTKWGKPNPIYANLNTQQEEPTTSYALDNIPGDTSRGWGEVSPGTTTGELKDSQATIHLNKFLELQRQITEQHDQLEPTQAYAASVLGLLPMILGYAIGGNRGGLAGAQAADAGVTSYFGGLDAKDKEDKQNKLSMAKTEYELYNKAREKQDKYEFLGAGQKGRVDLEKMREDNANKLATIKQLGNGSTGLPDVIKQNIAFRMGTSKVDVDPTELIDAISKLSKEQRAVYSTAMNALGTKVQSVASDTINNLDKVKVAHNSVKEMILPLIDNIMKTDASSGNAISNALKSGNVTPYLKDQSSPLYQLDLLLRPMAIELANSYTKRINQVELDQIKPMAEGASIYDGLGTQNPMEVLRRRITAVGDSFAKIYNDGLEGQKAFNRNIGQSEPLSYFNSALNKSGGSTSSMSPVDKLKKYAADNGLTLDQIKQMSPGDRAKIFK